MYYKLVNSMLLICDKKIIIAIEVSILNLYSIIFTKAQLFAGKSF